MTVSVKKIIPRTMAGLRDSLFDCMEKLRDGEMQREDAKIMADLAHTVIESIDVQLDFETKKIAEEIPQHLSDMNVVPPLNSLPNKAGT